MDIRIIGIAIFMFAGVVQFYFIEKVKRALKERHPNTWRDISSRGGFEEQAVASFILWRRDKTLGDRRLNTICRLGAFNYGLPFLGGLLWLAGDWFMSLIT